MASCLICAEALLELQLGLKGDLTMRKQAVNLAEGLYLEKFPRWWVPLGLPCTSPCDPGAWIFGTGALGWKRGQTDLSLFR